MAAENGAKDVVLNLLEKCLEKKSDSDLQVCYDEIYQLRFDLNINESSKA